MVTGKKGFTLCAVLVWGLVFSFLVASAAFGGQKYYVDKDGDGTTGLLSWDHALHYLQEALILAQDGDEIWVAADTYIPDFPQSLLLPGMEDETFHLTDGVTVYGGFNGTETHLSQRNVAANPTILSGDLDGDDGPDFQNRDDNSRHVVYADSTWGEDAVLNGFIITGGYADGGGGGGVWLDDCDGISIERCTLLDNWGLEGGGLRIEQSHSCVVSYSHIADNAARDLAGGMYIISASPQVIECTFNNNEAGIDANDGGGALCVFGNGPYAPTFERCVFESNSAVSRAGAAYLFGTSCKPFFNQCSFIGNQATDSGGGVYILGAMDPVFIDSIFRGNSSGYCGGAMVCVDYSSITAVNCAFLGNHAEDIGGAVYHEGEGYYENPSCVNCLFSGNYTSDYGAGGGMYINEGEMILTNATFSLNRAPDGITGGLLIEDSYPEVANCIFWGNQDTNGSIESSQIDLYSSGLNINYSCVQGWSGVHGGTDNMGDDPEFVDADGPDDTPGTQDDDPHLQETSPCMDAGEEAALPADKFDLDDDGDTGESIPYDLAGNERVYNDWLDMGAYEDFDENQDDSLRCSKCTIAVYQGDTATFTIDADEGSYSSNAYSIYCLFGTSSGSVPGIGLPGGVTLPINWDYLTDSILSRLNGPIFSNFLGMLDANSQATATFNCPPVNPNKIGMVLTFAYCLESLDFASNPVEIEFVP